LGVEGDFTLVFYPIEFAFRIPIENLRGKLWVNEEVNKKIIFACFFALIKAQVLSSAKNTHKFNE